MGRCEIGVSNITAKGKKPTFEPFFKFENDSSESIQFTCSHGWENEDDAIKFTMMCYDVIANPKKKKFVYDRRGVPRNFLNKKGSM